MNLLKLRERLSGSWPRYSWVFSVKILIFLADDFKVTFWPISRLAIICGLVVFIKGTILDIPGSSIKLIVCDLDLGIVLSAKG